MSGRGKRGSKHSGTHKTVKEREALYRMIVRCVSINAAIF